MRLGTIEIQVLLDACEDTLHRIRYDNKVKARRGYRNKVRRLKIKLEKQLELLTSNSEPKDKP